MPRTVVKCFDCRKEIPASQTKNGLAVKVLGSASNQSHLICVKCSLVRENKAMWKELEDASGYVDLNNEQKMRQFEEDFVMDNFS